MPKVLKQYRYFGESSSLNSPSGAAGSAITQQGLKSGKIFFNSEDLISIASLEIETWPGIQFYLNDSVDPIIVGASGVFELSLADNFELNALRFKKESVDLLMDSSNDAYLIVNVVYNTKEVTK